MNNEIIPINGTSVFFSDLHVRDNNDERWNLLKNFLNSNLTQESDNIFFLGDIFDLMIGPHDFYFDHYKYFFDSLSDFIKNGKNIYYFQGNHDFHIQNLFKKFFRKYLISDSSNFHLLDKEQLFSKNGLKIYLSHGDELDVDNGPYLRYKSIIRSRVSSFLANYIVSVHQLNRIGAFLAKKSKDNQKNFNWDSSFEKYRTYVQKKWDSGIQGVIVGHSHVCDAWEEGVHFYYNIGFAPMEKQFLYWGADGLQFVPLE